MRSRRTFAIVQNVPCDEIRREDAGVHERMWCTVRLKPVDILQVPDSDFGRPPSVPFAVHANQCLVLQWHKSSLCFCDRCSPQVDLTSGWLSHPMEGGQFAGLGMATARVFFDWNSDIGRMERV